MGRAHETGLDDKKHVKTTEVDEFSWRVYKLKVGIGPRNHKYIR
jgi:hypothetical protein